MLYLEEVEVKLELLSGSEYLFDSKEFYLGCQHLSVCLPGAVIEERMFDPCIHKQNRAPEKGLLL